MPVSSAPPCFRMTPEARDPPSPRRGRRRSRREGARMERSGRAGGGGRRWGAGGVDGVSLCEDIFFFSTGIRNRPYHLAVAKDVNQLNNKGQNRK